MAGNLLLLYNNRHPFPFSLHIFTLFSDSKNLIFIHIAHTEGAPKYRGSPWIKRAGWLFKFYIRPREYILSEGNLNEHSYRIRHSSTRTHVRPNEGASSICKDNGYATNSFLFCLGICGRREGLQYFLFHYFDKIFMLGAALGLIYNNIARLYYAAFYSV